MPGQLVRAYGLTIRLAPLLSSAACFRSPSRQLPVTASRAACGSGRAVGSSGGSRTLIRHVAGGARKEAFRIAAAEPVERSGEVVIEHSPAERGSPGANLQDAAARRQRPTLLPGRPAGRAKEVDHDDGLQPPEQPPPVPA